MNGLRALFGWWRSVRRPLVKDDPVFGRIRYQRAGFWEGDVYFAPEDRRYGITIDGGPDRPTDAQRAFFHELETRYPALKAVFADDLLEQLQNWNPEIRAEDVWAHFTLESFGLPDLAAGERAWEMIYELHDDGHLFGLLLEDWTVTGVRIDG